MIRWVSAAALLLPAAPAAWSSERTRFPKEVADKALAHKLPNRVEAAYRRTDFFEKRRSLMARWAEYLDRVPAREGRDSAPIPLRAAA